MATQWEGAIGAGALPRVTRAATAGERLHYLDNVRAIASVLIVATHCFGLAWSGSAGRWSDDSPLISLIAGGTPIFVFLSGFLFQRATRRGFDYGDLLRRRAMLLLPPYLAMTALLLASEHAMGVAALRYRIDDPLRQFVMALLLGNGGPAMWYIPFLIDMLLLSPLFLLFARMPAVGQRWVLVGLFLLGLCVDRQSLEPVPNVAHFSFHYALGIWCSQHRERFEALVRRPEVLIAALALMLLLMTMQYSISLHLADPALFWQRPKIVYLRKILLILVLCGVMLRVANRPVPGLALMGRWSFGVYFLHQLPLVLLLPFAAHDGIAPGYGGLLVYAALVYGVSLALVWIVRRALGRHSRYVIGV